MNNLGRTNLAQKYWLEHEQRLLAKRRTNPGIDQAELLNLVFLKLASVPNDRWEGIEKKDNYIQVTISRLLSGARPSNVTDQSFGGENPIDKVGQNPIDAYIAAILIKELKEMCSPDEKELLNLMHEGAKGKEIAEALDLSSDAARKRVQRLREKLQWKTNGGDKEPPNRVLSPRKFSKGSVQPIEEN